MLQFHRSTALESSHITISSKAYGVPKPDWCLHTQLVLECQHGHLLWCLASLYTLFCSKRAGKSCLKFGEGLYNQNRNKIVYREYPFCQVILMPSDKPGLKMRTFHDNRLYLLFISCVYWCHQALVVRIYLFIRNHEETWNQIKGFISRILPLETTQWEEYGEIPFKGV